MLSSRGIRSSLGAFHNGKGRPMIAQSQFRLYSQVLSSKRAQLQPFRISPPLRATSLQATQHLTTFGLRRHESTAATTVPDPAVPSEPNIPAPIPADGWDSLLNEVSTSYVNLEPHIGWLKELGLDYGWGPTSFMMKTFEYIQVYSGLPWWATTVVTVFGVRLLLLKWQIQSADIAGRMAFLAEDVKPIQAKMKAAHAAGDTLGQAAATQELRTTYSAAGVKPLKMIAPIVAQGVLGYGMFRCMNGMTRLPVPGLEEGGLLWFTDLSVPDPFSIIPIASGLMMWWVVKRGGENGTTNLSPVMMNMFLYVAPGVTTLVFWNLPAGMQWLAFITGGWAAVQGTLLRNPGVRQWLGITPLSAKRNGFSTAAASPYKGNLSTYRAPDEIAKSHTISSRWQTTRKTFSDFMQEQSRNKKTTRLSKTDLDKAKQYEKERRTEIDAARERFLGSQKRR